MRMLEINESNRDLAFTVPLTAKFHRIAEQFCREQTRPEKAEQVYRNTLAVLAVNFYCECMGIETDLEISESWNPVSRTLMDVADLPLKKLGKLECRAFMAGTPIVTVPAEVWLSRLGFIAVELSASMTEAKLIGFLQMIQTEAVPVEQWQSLEDFLEYLSQQQPKPQLREWLQGIWDHGWQAATALESLLAPQPEPSFRFRSRNFRNQNEALGGQLLKLEQGEEQIALFIGLSPTQEPEMDVSVEIYSVKPQTYLPQDLHLMVLDEAGEAVLQAVSKSSKTIQLEFSGYPGEQFSVKVALGKFSVEQGFFI